MRAMVVHATTDPRRLAVLGQVVRTELGPQFLSHPGAHHGYWMADRTTGHLLAITVWDSDELMASAAALDGAERAVVAERNGLRILSVHELEVIGAHETAMSAEPHLRWVRATWVDGLVPSVHGRLPQLYREAVPDQARSRGFCASYWLADLATGSALGLSMWEGPAELSDSALNSRRRRARFEELLGCRVGAVAEYQALGVAQPPARAQAAELRATAVGQRSSVLASTDEHVATGRVLRSQPDLGTTIECPPGALLAVRGDRAYQVVFLLDGQAALVRDADVVPIASGSHFGASSAARTQASPATVLATSPVKVHVFSRTEFGAVADRLPSVADDLIAHDMSR